MLQSPQSSPEIIEATDHKDRLSRKVKQAYAHLSDKRQGEILTEIWNSVRSNPKSHHKEKIKKKIFKRFMYKLQNKINQAQGTMFSYWSKRKEAVERKQEEEDDEKQILYLETIGMKRKLVSPEPDSRSKQRKWLINMLKHYKKKRNCWMQKLADYKAMLKHKERTE